MIFMGLALVQVTITLSLRGLRIFPFQLERNISFPDPSWVILRKMTELGTVCEGEHEHLLYYYCLHVYSQKILRVGNGTYVLPLWKWDDNGKFVYRQQPFGIFLLLLLPPTSCLLCTFKLTSTIYFFSYLDHFLRIIFIICKVNGTISCKTSRCSISI